MMLIIPSRIVSSIVTLEAMIQKLPVVAALSSVPVGITMIGLLYYES